MSGQGFPCHLGAGGRWLGGFLGMVMLLGIAVAPSARAFDRDWNQPLRKADLIVEPIGWYHMKFRRNPDILDNQVVVRPAEGNRLVGILVEVTNKSRYPYYFATENKFAKFRAGNKNLESLVFPFGYKLDVVLCTGLISIKIEPRETVHCLYMLEASWSVDEVRMSVPYPQGKSRGYWTLEISDKRSFNYLGYEQRQWDASWDDHQTGIDSGLVPITWFEGKISSTYRYPGRTSFYFVGFNASSFERTFRPESEDFRVYTYNGRPLDVLVISDDVDSSSCTIYSWNDDGFCTVIIAGPSNLKTLRIYFDFGSEDGFWNLKLDRSDNRYIGGF